jgi:riboflavin biosynthesis pyrimidine reductase
MKAILRASLSLDGKLLTQGGGSRRASITPGLLQSATELLLTVHPVLIGGRIPSLTGTPDGFLPKELRFELISAKFTRGTFLLRYRRTGGKSPAKALR